MSQRRSTEQGQHHTEYQWEVDSLPEVDKRGRGDMKCRDRLIRVEIAVYGCLPAGGRTRSCQEPTTVGVLYHGVLTCQFLWVPCTNGAFVAGDGEHGAAAKSDHSAGARGTTPERPLGTARSSPET